MEVIKQISGLRSFLRELRHNNQKIGLVPTMGALHEGHLSLVNASVQENDITAASLFVNPAQFNNPEDFQKYPLSIEKDLAMFEEAGTDLVFMPSREEMYPAPALIKFNFDKLTENMEGKYRPGHFNGVALIVSKLFNLFQPDRAYFGQKDLQQFKVIQQLNEDLNFGIELRMQPIIRESNGLAMSSRNRRLSAQGIDKAGLIYQSLLFAENELKARKSVSAITRKVESMFTEEGIELEYFEIVSFSDLSRLNETLEVKELAICIACYVEGVRLIDNSLLTLR